MSFETKSLPLNTIDVWVVTEHVISSAKRGISGMPGGPSSQAPRDDVLQYLQYLSTDEVSRANRFVFPHHRERFIIYHAALRIILSKYLKIPPQNLKFSTSSHGKPYLPDYLNLTFNMTHSENLALVAVGNTYELGIDTEFMRARDYIGIMGQVFSKEEQEKVIINKCLEPLSFYTLWAQKESLMKATGLGFAYPIAEVTLPLWVEKPTKIVDPITKKDWRLLSFMPAPLYPSALCYDMAVEKINFHTLD